MTTYIYPYNSGSRSVRALKQALDIRKIRRENSRYRNRATNVVINWGCGNIDNQEVMSGRIINNPSVVNDMTHKLRFFQKMQGEDLSDFIPPFTTDINVARQWQEEEQHVVARTVLQGHSGEGIVLAGPNDELVQAPLYTKYIKKREEYRVHVCRKPDGEAVAFDIQRKARRTDVDDNDVNWKIRNNANGFIYARNERHTPHQSVVATALRIFEATGLDFGAIDIIYNNHQQRSYALEVNTAPGLEGTTLEQYTLMLQELVA